MCSVSLLLFSIFVIGSGTADRTREHHASVLSPDSDTRSTRKKRRRRHGSAKPPARCGRGVRGGVRPPLPHPPRRPCWLRKPEHRRRRSGLSIPLLQTPTARLSVLTRIKQALPASPVVVFSTVALLSTGSSSPPFIASPFTAPEPLTPALLRRGSPRYL